MLSTFPHLALTWDDLAWLRELTDAAAARQGRAHGRGRAARASTPASTAIIVSNHGGRQVDGAVAALDALVEVREALGADATVLMDGGIRHGADVVKALALGADAVLVGRPYAYGLAVGGQEGVEQVLPHLWAETDITMALAGLSSVRELDPSILRSDMTACPSCGRDNPDDARFCSACGARARRRRARARDAQGRHRALLRPRRLDARSASPPTPRRFARACAATSQISARSSSGTAARSRSSSATR